jgi:hypothetical protein
MFDDIPNKVSVFRAPAGTRYPIRIDDKRLTSYCFAVCEVYQSMSSVDKGIAQVSPNNKYITISWSKNYSTPVKWIVIGDDRGFYFYSTVASNFYSSYQDSPYQVNYTGIYLGDYIPYDPRNKRNFISCISDDANVFSPNAQLGLTNGPFTIADSQSVEGVLPSVAYVHLNNVSGSNQSIVGRQNSLNLDNIPLYGEYVFSGNTISEYVNNKYVLIGQLPGYLSMYWRPDNPNPLTEADFPEFTVNNSNLSIYVFGNLGLNDSDHGRNSIIVGNGFRNVY